MEPIKAIKHCGRFYPVNLVGCQVRTMTNKTRKDCLHFDGVWCALHEDDDDDCPSVCKDFADGQKCNDSGKGEK